MSTCGGSILSLARPRRQRPGAAALAGLLLFAAGAARGDEAPAAEAGFAGFLLRLGLAKEAGREVWRLTLLGGEHAPPAEEIFRVGSALASSGDAAGAADLLALAVDRTDDPALADHRQLALGVVLLRARSYPRAVQIFSRLQAFAESEAIRSRAARLRCIGQAFAGNGGAARECAATELDAARLALADGPLRTLRIDPDRRAVVGGVLSGLVPGLGQLTAGDPGDAGIALLVNGAWGAGFYLLVADAAILDATLLGLGVGLRYYLGNIRNGALAWKARAERRRGEASARLMRLLAEDGGGRIADDRVPPGR